MAGEAARHWSAEADRTMAAIVRRLEPDAPKQGWPRMEVRLLDPKQASFDGVRLTRDAASGGMVLEVGGADGLTEKELRDGMVRYGLEALVDARRGGGASSEWACIPDWYAVGLAETLNDAARPAWRSALTARMAFESPPSAQEVLRWHVLPRGWHGPRLWSRFFFEWLGERDPRRRIYAESLDRFGTGETVSAQWLAAALGFSSVEAMNTDWQQWLGAQRRMMQPAGYHTAADLVNLRKALWMDGGEEGQGGRMLEEELWTKEETRAAARLKAVELRALGIGRGPEFSALAERFALFYEGIAEGRARWLSRRRLAEAWRELERIERVTLERARYMDEAEVRLTGAAEATDDELCLDPSDMRRYVDETERRWRAASLSEP